MSIGSLTLRPTRRWLVGAVAALLATTALPASPALPTLGEADCAVAKDCTVAAGWHEAKLRKLHLVRPDLISYPLFFDVIC